MSTSFIASLQRQITVVENQLKQFQESFAKDPAHALAWSNDTFKRAAGLTVLKQVVKSLESGTSVEDIKSTLTDRVMSRSKYPAQSTSPTSNLIEQYELAAYAEILCYINDLQSIHA